MKFGLLLNHQAISKYFFGRFKKVLLRCSFLLYMCCGYGNKKAAAAIVNAVDTAMKLIFCVTSR
jgi:hypothetical protein